MLATLDAYGGGLVKYAVSQDGIWLFSLAQPLTASESESLTGYHPTDLVPKQIDGVEGYFYALQGGAPLLPLPFTAVQLTEFNKRTAGLIASCIDRGSETDAWIADLGKDNPDARALAKGIRSGKWPVDLADFADAKPDHAAKPRFRLAHGIQLSASDKTINSAFKKIKLQEDTMHNMGISPEWLKAVAQHSEIEKLIGNSVGGLNSTAYINDFVRNQDMLRVMNPSASEMAAEALGRQLISTSAFDTCANGDLMRQATTQAEIEKAMGSSIGTVAEAMRQHEKLGYANTVANTYPHAYYPQQTELEKSIALISGSVANSFGQLDRAGLDAAMGIYHPPTTRDMVDQMAREHIEKAWAPPELHKTVIEYTPLPVYDHRADEDRRLARERNHRLETARLEEITRQEVREEYEARKQTASPTPATDATPVVSEGATVSAGNERVGPS